MATEEMHLKDVDSLPLNSGRLTAAHLQGLALALSLPTSVSSEDLCQMIERMGKELRTVQVVVAEAEGGRAESL